MFTLIPANRVPYHPRWTLTDCRRNCLGCHPDTAVRWRLLAVGLCIGLIAALITGCASDGGQCPASLSNPYPSPAAMQTLPPETVALGEHFTWGGLLIDVRHLSDATELDISARPLDAACRVRKNAPEQGRFRVRLPGNFATAALASGQPLRVSGRLAAMETRVDSGARIPVVTEAVLSGLPRPGTADILGGRYRPNISIGVGVGSGGWSGGGIGISF